MITVSKCLMNYMLYTCIPASVTGPLIFLMFSTNLLSGIILQSQKPPELLVSLPRKLSILPTAPDPKEPIGDFVCFVHFGEVMA